MVERSGRASLTNRDRHGIAAAANVIALVAFAAVDAACMHQPRQWRIAEYIAYIGLSVLIAYFGWRASFLEAAFARARETAPKDPTDDGWWWLYLGALVNMGVVSCIVVFTGGTLGPFLAFPGGFVLFSQFLADSRRAVVMSLMAGGGLILALWLLPGLPEFAKQYALPAGSVSAVAQRSALAIVAIGAIAVGTICTIPRRKKKEEE